MNVPVRTATTVKGHAFSSLTLPKHFFTFPQIDHRMRYTDTRGLDNVSTFCTRTVQ